VRTENAAGGLSRVSNMAGGPSRAALITFPGLEERLDLADQVRPAKSRTRILKLFRRARMAAQAGSVPATDRLLGWAEKGLKQGPVAQRMQVTEIQDLTFFLQGLRRNVWLGQQDLLPLDFVVEGVP
jgi:hypothetical protein